MKEDVIQRIKIYLNSKSLSNRALAERLNMSEKTLNNKLNGTRGLDLDTLQKIILLFEELSSEWLLTGKGEMLKCNIAGRDNVGTGNEIVGDNTGVIGNTGIVGNVGGNHVSIPSNNIKKIMNEDGVDIEFVQSTDSLQQMNVHLEARIKDLEMLNASQAKTIEAMQLLIDMLTKK